MSPFDLSKLNPPQREAVAHGSGPLLILAGAGTGKTRVITARICHLIHTGIEPTAILAVTFTNKAANEMRERLAVILPKEAANKVLISTFHSFCVRLLRADIHRLGYKNNFTICDESDQVGLLKKIARQLLKKDQAADIWQIKAKISEAKTHGLAPPEYDDEPVGAVYARYQRELRGLNALDFEDLLNLGVRLLERHEEVRTRLQRRFQHLLVDEFQDTNSRQVELLRLLCRAPFNICVVGDDDQSIYGWRGAEISNILEFERHFPDPKVIRLEQNYRSTGAVLHTANSLIRHNPRRRAKQLWSDKGDGDAVLLVTCRDEKEEAQFVADRILAGRRKGAKWEDFAILFRINLQAQPFEEEFRRQRIPYRIVGTKSFYDKREVRDLLAWLRCVQNPQDDISLLRALSAPARGIGEGTVEKAIAQSASVRRSVFETFENADFRAQLPPRSGNAVAEFANFVGTWSARLAGAPPPHYSMVKDLIAEIGFEEYLQRSSASKEEGDARCESIALLLDQMRERGLGLTDFLDEISLDNERFSDKKEDMGFGASLITLHAAKGLEFPDVYLVGLEEGLLPHTKSREENRLDEERRLFYVGMTRAMNRLTISYCLSRTKYGKPAPRNPSTFLEQLDRKNLQSTSARSVLCEPLPEGDIRDRFRELKEKLVAAQKTPY